MCKMYMGLAVLLLPACSNPEAAREKRDELYRQAFEREHPGWLASAGLKCFDDRYENIKNTVRTIDLADSLLLIDTAARPDTLCFAWAPDRDVYAQMQVTEVKSEEEGVFSPVLFAQYPPVSKQVNAVLLGADFYQNDTLPTGITEPEYTMARLSRNRQAFVERAGGLSGSNRQVYQAFCRARRYAAELCGVRYVLVLKKAVSRAPERLMPGEVLSHYKAGRVFALLYVYDLEKKSLLALLPVLAGNSAHVQVYDKNTGAAMERDLSKNYAAEVQAVIQRAYPVKGELPVLLNP